MNTYAKVQSLITAWKSQSLSRTDLIRAIAEACLKTHENAQGDGPFGPSRRSS